MNLSIELIRLSKKPIKITTPIANIVPGKA